MDGAAMADIGAVPHIAQEIWETRYRWRAPGGDASIRDMWRRVADCAAEAEMPHLRAQWAERFHDCLGRYEFLPAGRVLASAGTTRDATLFNCFVMGAIPDSIPGIFQALSESALTMQRGGGIGMDFSTLRPRDSLVRGTGETASGPVSFMDTWDAMCGTMMSAGMRRGAMMGCLRIDHPDIEQFIDAKRQPDRLRRFNVSVLVPDAFMRALERDAPWPLVFEGKVHRVVRAQALWTQMMRATYDTAEPGIIFIDRVNAANNLRYCETIFASNPCGEQMLPPYGACLLGSLNLAALVRHPFEPHAALDEARLKTLTRLAVRFLDNIIDVSRFPLAQQAEEARSKRRIGLGITGLADALIFCNLRYGSAASYSVTAHWLDIIRREAYRASAKLAREKGAFACYGAEFLQSDVCGKLDTETLLLVRRHGLRNGCLTSIAPTGTISLLAGNVSSGIEPIFDYSFSRNVRQKDGGTALEEVEDFAYSLWRRLRGTQRVPKDIFVRAHDLTPEEHVRMQAVAQQYVDSSISKTINLPRELSFEEFKSVYITAYAAGCKGCTTYRPTPLRGEVLVAGRQDCAVGTMPKPVLGECAVCE